MSEIEAAVVKILKERQKHNARVLLVVDILAFFLLLLELLLVRPDLLGGVVFALADFLARLEACKSGCPA
jgi:hypothetical protein